MASNGVKKILIFSLSYYPHVGGAEVAIKEITDRIPDIEFHMITMNFGKEPLEERIGNVVVHRIGKGSSYLSKILFIPSAALSAYDLQQRLRFDAFWAMMSYMAWPIALMRLKGDRTPYLLTLQDGDPFEHVFRRWFILPFYPLLSYGFRHATMISAISTYLGGWARRMGFAGEVRIIPNGADLTRFTRSAPVPLETAGEIKLVTSSRLVHKNAVDDVIRALVMLPENVRFIVYGTGKEEKNLLQLASELRVNERLELRGHVGHTELAKAYEHAHIFVRPSRTEGFGASFPEAMAAGLPVIATQEGGIADFLFDEKRNPDKESTGWAVDVNAPDQIAMAVKDIMLNPDKVARVTANAKRMVVHKYDWNLIATQMKTAFEAVFARLSNH